MMCVIRMTSSGKSLFINMLAPWNEIREGHKPRSGQILKRTNGFGDDPQDDGQTLNAVTRLLSYY